MLTYVILDKPYVNEVLEGNNLSLKFCQPLELLTYFESGFKSFHSWNFCWFKGCKVTVRQTLKMIRSRVETNLGRYIPTLFWRGSKKILINGLQNLLFKILKILKPRNSLLKNNESSPQIILSKCDEKNVENLFFFILFIRK